MKSLADFVNQRVALYENPTILDIGCGDKKISKHFNRVTTIDVEESYSPTIVRNMEFGDLDMSWKFDIILMLDFIEHLTKPRGFQVLEQAKKICDKEIILLTPYKWSQNLNIGPNSFYYGNIYNRHRSLWGKADLPDFELHKVERPWYLVGVWRRGVCTSMTPKPAVSTVQQS